MNTIRDKVGLNALANDDDDIVEKMTFSIFVKIMGYIEQARSHQSLLVFKNFMKYANQVRKFFNKRKL